MLTIVHWTSNFFIPMNLINGLPSGALPILLSLYHFYKQYTPKIYEYQILLWRPNFLKFGKANATNAKIMLTLNDQFLLDSLVWLLLLNQGFVGLTYGFISWIIGICISKHILPGLDHWKVPFLERYIFKRDKRSSSMETESLLNNAEELPATTIDSSINTDTGTSMSSTTNLMGGGNGMDNNTTTLSEHGSDNDTNETLEANDEPVRPLGVQFLDTFRR